MSGRTDSDAAPAISRAAEADAADAAEDHDESDAHGEPGARDESGDHDGPDAPDESDAHHESGAHDESDASDEPVDNDERYDHGEHVGEARRARWAAAGAGGLLCLAGCAAALLRLTGPAPAVVPAAYALGAAVCALAAVLGSRGRTRRALWLLVAGTAVMAVGDQFD
ncbi:hypothetical protein ACFYVM_27925 [Streptomyces sp. NPDC003280]|uniref:hypothetical protein n=1 Tax=Streptomyces sp. NPDC003280 TaxID=3364680 RepID=UPI0036B9F3A3